VSRCGQNWRTSTPPIAGAVATDEQVRSGSRIWPQFRNKGQIPEVASKTTRAGRRDQLPGAGARAAARPNRPISASRPASARPCHLIAACAHAATAASASPRTDPVGPGGKGSRPSVAARRQPGADLLGGVHPDAADRGVVRGLLRDGEGRQRHGLWARRRVGRDTIWSWRRSCTCRGRRSTGRRRRRPPGPPPRPATVSPGTRRSRSRSTMAVPGRGSPNAGIPGTLARDRRPRAMRPTSGTGPRGTETSGTTGSRWSRFPALSA
jgi:hypothetical protein